MSHPDAPWRAFLRRTVKRRTVGPRRAAKRERRSARDRRLVKVTAIGAIAVALVAGVAVVAQGYERSEQDLSDASVWVTKADRALLGHANTAISSLSTAIGLDGDGGTVAQDATHVVMHDEDKNTLSLVDPARAKPLATVNLPAGHPQVAASGGWVGVLDPGDGSVWVRGLDELQGFDPHADPDGQVGVDAVIAVDQKGRWAGYSQSTSRVSVGGRGAAPRVEDVEFSKPAEHAQVALIGGRPAVFNPVSDEVWFRGRVHPLDAVVTDPDSVRLQSSTTSDGDVVLSHDGGLAVAAATADRVDLPVSGVQGLTTSPMRVGSCLYAAWGSGRAVQWCDGRDPETFPLKGGPIGDLVLRVNEDTVVANDPRSGATWALQNGGALIDNWDDFKDQSKVVRRQREDLDVPPQPRKDQVPPAAQDDTLGARAGRANLLPVLLNDADANGDPLVITRVTGAESTRGDVQIVEDGQRLQLTPRPDAAGAFSLRYTVTDGHGGTASATATVRIVDASVNNAPHQARPSKTSVALEGHASAEVLQDWVDPESDPMYLVGATVDAPNQVSTTPQGRVDFLQGGGDPGLENARVKVSDGTAVGDGLVNVTVQPQGRTPIIAENYTLTGYVGNEIVTRPVEASRGGTGELTLAQVEADSGESTALRVSASYADGTVRIVPQEAGSHRVVYSVRDADGKQTAVGVIRVEAQGAPEGATAPVVSPSTAFVHRNSTTDVDVLRNAYDPAGRVLSISSVQEPANGVLAVEVVEREHLRVLLTGEADGPVTFSVTVSNGTEQSTGQVVVIRVPEPTREQAPVARDDAVKARAGDVVDIPVLANDTQADGKPITLGRELVQAPRAGLLVSTGERLRYLAPDTPGTYTARYRITAATGLSATGSVRIDVTARDGAGNRAPGPPVVTARTAAGQSVKISVPLEGTDPDGDSVTLSGVQRQPAKGSVSLEGNVIEYTANPGSLGTDTFGYQAVDALGAVSVGTVRVGIDSATAASAPPVAQDDLVTTRPRTQLSVDVTANDIDNTRKGLGVAVEAVTDVQHDGDARATASGHTISLRTPNHAGTIAVLYSVKDATGATSQAWLYIDVRRDAPLAAPVTEDQLLSLADIEGKDRVPVDVLGDATFTEGAVSTLRVEVPEGYGGATVLPDGRVEVPVGDDSAIIPFTLSRPDAHEVSSTSFIRVPGHTHAKPELREDAPALTVESGEELVIPLAGHVIAAGERRVTLGNTGALSASNGEVSARGDASLVFRSRDTFWGTANVTFVATDGRESAQLTLKIAVTSKAKQPPTLQDAQISVESGGSHVTELRALTDVAGGARQERGLRFSASGGDPAVASYVVDGDRLKVTAADGDTVGRSTTLRLHVSDADGLGADSTVSITVTRSRKALPRTQDDEATVRRGRSVTVDVLANDASPFPDKALTVVDVKAVSVVQGVHVSGASGGHKVTVTADDAAATGVSTVDYTVQDSTGDPARRAVGQLRVTVQDVPDAPPGAPVVAERRPEAKAVVLSIGAAEANGSPVTGYEYRANGDAGPSGSCEGPQSCLVTGLDWATDYSFQMRAVNELGPGAWSGRSATVTMDQAPDVPRALSAQPSGRDPGGHSIVVAWTPPAAASWGTAVKGYELRLRGIGGDSVFSYGSGTTSATLRQDWIRPGQRYTLTLTARNESASSEAATTEVVAVGAPSVTDAQAGIVGGGKDVTVHWNQDDGGAAATTRVVPADGAGECSLKLDPNTDGTSYRTSIDRGTRFVVMISNGLFCSRAATTTVDASVRAPSGDTRAVQSNDEPGLYGTQPQYRLNPGEGRYTFLNLTGDAAPSPSAGGWSADQADGAWHDFGTQDTDVSVYAVSCRDLDRAFCSDVVSLGTQRKHSEDLRFGVDGAGQCRADGGSTLHVTTRATGDAAPAVSYRLGGPAADPEWRDLPADGDIHVPAAEPGADPVTVRIRSELGDHPAFEPRDPAARCEAPPEPTPGPTPATTTPAPGGSPEPDPTASGTEGGTAAPDETPTNPAKDTP